MKLNNRGFAIIGILYGLLILFVFTISSLLTVMVSKKNRVDKLIEEIEEKEGYNTCFYENNGECHDTSIEISTIVADYTGKYMFTINGRKCFTYLYANQTIPIENLKCYVKDNGKLSQIVINGSDKALLNQIYY